MFLAASDKRRKQRSGYSLSWERLIALVLNAAVWLMVIGVGVRLTIR